MESQGEGKGGGGGEGEEGVLQTGGGKAVLPVREHDSGGQSLQEGLAVRGYGSIISAW